MLTGSQIEKLVELLQTRGVFLYHACQYQDLVSYLNLGGVPSRNRLTSASLDLTAFDTDRADRVNGVWDKVFVNLEDFGRGFALGRAAVPNPYGPLLLRLSPWALFEAEDVAICLRSAGGWGFNRERESLKTVTDVNRVFWNPTSAGRGSELLKFGDTLRKEFGSKAQAVEVSCTCTTGLLPFDELCGVVVDPYTIEGASLAEWTRRAIADSRLDVPVRIRKPKIDVSVYDEMASLVRQRTPALTEIPNLTAHNLVLNWAERIPRRLEYQFKRFAGYLRTGTLEPLAAQARTAVRDKYEAKPDYFYDLYEDYGPYEEENRLIIQEFYQDAEAWNRSHDEGWYYAD